MGVLKNMIDKINTNNASRKIIGEEQIAKACELLTYYKQGKANLEQRIISEEKFYKLQHWENQSKDEKKEKRPTTAWLLNSIVNKHADLMDNYPEAICLPRETQDEADAKRLSEIIPVILEHNDYERTYSKTGWYFTKHGTGVQGVFWDNKKQNGLGDVSIKNIDILNLFWEPGITDLQESANVFYVSLVDNEALREAYPEIEERSGGNAVINLAEYIYDDTIDNSKKTMVVDWYYKKDLPDGRTLLHYVKFSGKTILFASENEEGYENGFYEHGEYPFTLAPLFPDEGTPTGFGYIAVCRDPQQYIDTLDGLMLDYAYKTANPRYWCKKSAGVNKDDFLDWSNPIVEVEGDIDEEKLKQITIQQLGTSVYNLRQMKVDELKETSSNRDFSQGGTSGGITSGAAIATLQEAGNKTSRDMIRSMYRSYVDVVRLTIELIRQFYTEEREFRITGQNGTYEFVRYDNTNLTEQANQSATGEKYFRKPIFDIDVKAQKASAYSKMAQNETAVNLFSMGVFNPELAQQSLVMLDMMDFDGKEKVKQYVMQGQTLQNVVQQQQQQIMQLSAQLSALTVPLSQNQTGAKAGNDTSEHMSGGGVENPLKTAQENAMQRHNMPYMEELAKKARVDVNGG